MIWLPAFHKRTHKETWTKMNELKNKNHDVFNIFFAQISKFLLKSLICAELSKYLFSYTQIYINIIL